MDERVGEPQINADTGLSVNSAIMPAMKKDGVWWYVLIINSVPSDVAQSTVELMRVRIIVSEVHNKK